MTDANKGPDPVVDADRLAGTTRPEKGDESASVGGRPAVEPAPRAFHQRGETPDKERKHLTEREALDEGGSFDAIVPPGDEPAEN
jgi:hypothetical protein